MPQEARMVGRASRRGHAAVSTSLASGRDTVTLGCWAKVREAVDCRFCLQRQRQKTRTGSARGWRVPCRIVGRRCRLLT
eukprot:22095-Eustigmatos_ZCMA.PRE.1